MFGCWTVTFNYSLLGMSGDLQYIFQFQWKKSCEDVLNSTMKFKKLWWSIICSLRILPSLAKHHSGFVKMRTQHQSARIMPCSSRWVKLCKILCHRNIWAVWWWKKVEASTIVAPQQRWNWDLYCWRHPCCQSEMCLE